MPAQGLFLRARVFTRQTTENQNRRQQNRVRRPGQNLNVLRVPEGRMILESKKTWAWLWVFCYAVLIFLCSALPAKLVPQAFWAYDKIVHISLYLPFGFLVSRALAKTIRWGGFNALLVFIFMIMMYALSDEIHQLFVPGRHFSWLDLAADSAGAMIGRRVYTLWPK